MESKSLLSFYAIDEKPGGVTVLKRSLVYNFLVFLIVSFFSFLIARSVFNITFSFGYAVVAFSTPIILVLTFSFFKGGIWFPFFKLDLEQGLIWIHNSRVINVSDISHFLAQLEPDTSPDSGPVTRFYICLEDGERILILKSFSHKRLSNFFEDVSIRTSKRIIKENYTRIKFDQ